MDEPTDASTDHRDERPATDGAHPRVRRRRWPFAIVGFGALVVAALVLGAFPLFINPAVDTPEAVDAIVVLQGGGERYDPGVALLEQGYADVIWFSDPGRSTDPFTANQYCNSKNALRIPDGTTQICHDPDPNTTQGEVRAIADAARANGWERIIMIASTDQVSRARMLLERCWDGEILMVNVDHDQRAAIRAVYEWGATIKAHTLKRGC